MAIGFISWLFSVDLDSYFEDCYLFFGFILFITVIILCELFFLALIVYSLKYFKIERTPSEIIFQKGIKQDRIPLDQINKVVLDYTVIKSKVRILIVLFIPNHTIGIVKTIKMISMIPNQSFLESQLVKVLIKTLFLLGYAPNQ